MPEIWNWFCPPLSVHVSYSRFRDMERLIVFEYLRWKLTILADSGCGLNLTTHMAKRANITTHTTVLSRDSLPTDPMLNSGKQNRLSVAPNPEMLTRTKPSRPRPRPRTWPSRPRPKQGIFAATSRPTLAVRYRKRGPLKRCIRGLNL